jgi:putative membrane protein insertion efficiency factor
MVPQGMTLPIQPRNFLQKYSMLVCIFMVRLYQIFLSPLFPPSCRFTPTCSQYAMDAIRHHGALHGTFLALRRILRCHPFNRGGYDPIDHR